MGRQRRSPTVHAFLVAFSVLGTFFLILGLLYLLAVFLIPYGATPS